MDREDVLCLEDIVSDPESLKKRLRGLREAAGKSANGRNWAIRIHRAHSWFSKAMALAQDQEASREFAEAKLVMLWVALSALASRWDADKGQPRPESADMYQFFDAFADMAGDQLIVDFVGRHKSVLRRLLANKFLRMDFWKNPFDPKLPDLIEASQKLIARADEPKIAQLIIKESLYRVFILRGQLVHGASTAGSKLNREALADAQTFLQNFIPVVIQVCLEQGLACEWPPICFPPVDPRQKDQLKLMAGVV